jgi:hypothetical protein
MAFSGDKTKVLPGPNEVTINGVQLGHTEENVEVIEFGDSVKRHHSHEASDVPIRHTQLPRPITIRIRSLEITNSVLAEAFPEADSITTSGVVSVHQDNFTELTPIEVTIHPTVAGASTKNDHTYKDMVVVGPPINTAWGSEDKLKIDLTLERQWRDSGLTHQIGGFEDPA